MGHWGVGDLQRLLWSNRVAASLGELSADVKRGAAAALCAQQALWRGPPEWQTNLQPFPVPCCVASWTMDPGTTRRLCTRTHYFTAVNSLEELGYIQLYFPSQCPRWIQPSSLWTRTALTLPPHFWTPSDILDKRVFPLCALALMSWLNSSFLFLHCPWCIFFRQTWTSVFQTTSLLLSLTSSVPSTVSGS